MLAAIFGLVQSSKYKQTADKSADAGEYISLAFSILQTKGQNDYLEQVQVLLISSLYFYGQGMWVKAKCLSDMAVDLAVTHNFPTIVQPIYKRAWAATFALNTLYSGRIGVMPKVNAQDWPHPKIPEDDIEEWDPWNEMALDIPLGSSQALKIEPARLLSCFNCLLGVISSYNSFIFKLNKLISSKTATLSQLKQLLETSFRSLEIWKKRESTRILLSDSMYEKALHVCNLRAVYCGVLFSLIMFLIPPFGSDINTITTASSTLSFNIQESLSEAHDETKNLFRKQTFETKLVMPALDHVLALYSSRLFSAIRTSQDHELACLFTLVQSRRLQKYWRTGDKHMELLKTNLSDQMIMDEYRRVSPTPPPALALSTPLPPQSSSSHAISGQTENEINQSEDGYNALRNLSRLEMQLGPTLYGGPVGDKDMADIGMYSSNSNSNANTNTNTNTNANANSNSDMSISHPDSENELGLAGTTDLLDLSLFDFKKDSDSDRMGQFMENLGFIAEQQEMGFSNSHSHSHPYSQSYPHTSFLQSSPLQSSSLQSSSSMHGQQSDEASGSNDMPTILNKPGYDADLFPIADDYMEKLLFKMKGGGLM